MSLGWTELHDLIGISPSQDHDFVYTGVSSLTDARSGEISFLGNSRYETQLRATQASLVLVPKGDFSSTPGCHLLSVDNPSVAMILTQFPIFSVLLNRHKIFFPICKMIEG